MSTFDKSKYIAWDPNDSDDSPADISDIIYGSLSTKNLVEDITTRRRKFPDDVNRTLLFYGPPGTGKTSLAFHLFDNLTNGQTAQRYRAVPGADGVELAKYVAMPDDVARVSETFDAYLVDEVDNFSKSALKVLKNGMDDPYKQFIFTTNNIDALDKLPGFVSRCIKLEMPSAGMKLMTLANHVLAECQCTNAVPSTVEDIVRKSKGDIRVIYNEVRRYARDKNAATKAAQLKVV